MEAVVRPVALTLAVFAMVLRAFLPDGWMPGTDASTPVILCPGQSGTQGMPMHGMPLPHGLPQHRTSVCPFTTLAHLVTPVVAPLMAVPVVQHVPRRPAPVAFVFAATSYRAQSPRGPPLSV